MSLKVTLGKFLPTTRKEFVDVLLARQLRQNLKRKRNDKATVATSMATPPGSPELSLGNLHIVEARTVRPPTSTPLPTFPTAPPPSGPSMPTTPIPPGTRVNPAFTANPEEQAQALRKQVKALNPQAKRGASKPAKVLTGLMLVPGTALIPALAFLAAPVISLGLPFAGIGLGVMLVLDLVSYLAMRSKVAPGLKEELTSLTGESLGCELLAQRLAENNMEPKLVNLLRSCLDTRQVDQIISLAQQLTALEEALTAIELRINGGDLRDDYQSQIDNMIAGTNLANLDQLNVQAQVVKVRILARVSSAIQATQTYQESWQGVARAFADLFLMRRLINNLVFDKTAGESGYEAYLHEPNDKVHQVIENSEPGFFDQLREIDPLNPDIHSTLSGQIENAVSSLTGQAERLRQIVQAREIISRNTPESLGSYYKGDLALVQRDQAFLQALAGRSDTDSGPRPLDRDTHGELARQIESFLDNNLQTFIADLLKSTRRDGRLNIPQNPTDLRNNLSLLTTLRAREERQPIIEAIKQSPVAYLVPMLVETWTDGAQKQRLQSVLSTALYDIILDADLNKRGMEITTALRAMHYSYWALVNLSNNGAMTSYDRAEEVAARIETLVGYLEKKSEQHNLLAKAAEPKKNEKDVVVHDRRTYIIVPGKEPTSTVIPAGQYINGGGFSDLYLALDPRKQEFVVIKVLNPQKLINDSGQPQEDPAVTRRRMRREARNAIHLRERAENEPNWQHVKDRFVRTIDFTVIGPDNLHGIVMERMQIPDLEDLIIKENLPLTVRLKLGIKICEALELMHNSGMKHRDLKPANLFANISNSNNPQVWLSDFGGSKIRDSRGHTLVDQEATRTGMGLGTFAYQSPDDIRQSGSGAPCPDIFALGVILYTTGTKNHPAVWEIHGAPGQSVETKLGGEAHLAIATAPPFIKAKLLGTYSSSSGVSFTHDPELFQIIERAMYHSRCKDDIKPFENVTELKAALQALLDKTEGRTTDSSLQPVDTGMFVIEPIGENSAEIIATCKQIRLGTLKPPADELSTYKNRLEELITNSDPKVAKFAQRALETINRLIEEAK